MTNQITKQEAISSLAPDLSYNLYPDGKIELAKIDGQENKGVIPSEEAITAERAKLQAEYDAQEYIRQRKKEYPSLEECIHAILDDGLEELQAKRQAVKQKYKKG